MLSWVSCHSDWFTSSEVFHKKVLDAASSHHTTLLLTTALGVTVYSFVVVPALSRV